MAILSFVAPEGISEIQERVSKIFSKSFGVERSVHRYPACISLPLEPEHPVIEFVAQRGTRVLGTLFAAQDHDGAELSDLPILLASGGIKIIRSTFHALCCQ